MNLRILLYHVLLFLGVFLPLWLSDATGPGWASLTAAIPNALLMTFQKIEGKL